jgi:hypothetical protein
MGADGLRRGPALHLRHSRAQLVHGRDGCGDGHPTIIEQPFDNVNVTTSG